MFDFIFGIGGVLVTIVTVILAILGFGAKKKAEGRKAERARAQEAQDAATEEAARIREKVTTKPISKRREGFKQWEK